MFQLRVSERKRDTSLLSLDRYASSSWCVSMCKCECASIHFQLTMSMHLVRMSNCKTNQQLSSLKEQKIKRNTPSTSSPNHFKWNGFRTRFGMKHRVHRASWHNMIQRIPLCCVLHSFSLTAWLPLSSLLLLIFCCCCFQLLFSLCLSLNAFRMHSKPSTNKNYNKIIQKKQDK